MKNHLDRNIFTDYDIEDFIDYICNAGIRTKIFYLWRPYLRNLFDDHVLELAINSGAEMIVTFNKKDFLDTETKSLIRKEAVSVNCEETFKGSYTYDESSKEIVRDYVSQNVYNALLKKYDELSTWLEKR